MIDTVPDNKLVDVCLSRAYYTIAPKRRNPATGPCPQRSASFPLNCSAGVGSHPRPYSPKSREGAPH